MEELEHSIFQNTKIDEASLLAFGFSKAHDHFEYRGSLASSGLDYVVQVSFNGEVQIHVYEDGEEYEGYRRQILGNFNGAMKEEIIALLAQIKKACFISLRQPTYFLIPSNPKIYDIDRGFAQNQGYLDWPAKKKLHEGDIVYIYSAVPFKGIRYRCLVVAVGEAGEGYGSHTIYPTLIHLEKAYPQGTISLEEAKAHGLKTVRFAHKMNPETGKYFDSF